MGADAVIKRGVHPIWRDRHRGLAVRCYVCDKETPPRQRYCDRCREFFRSDYERNKRRAALIAAYDKDQDGFRCHWCNAILEERDHDDPFHLCFDHFFPVRKSKLVVSSELFNHMKFELTPKEFRRVIEELNEHHGGKRFDRNCIKFSHWGRKAPFPRVSIPGETDRTGTGACVICGEPRSGRKYCSRCRSFMLLHHDNRRLRARALKRAWNKEEGGFCCHYTGVRVEEDDPESPWYLSFDHAVPGDPETLVVTAWWVNAMKTSLSEDEYWTVIEELIACWREKREFNKNIVPFDYWRKERRR